MSLWYEFKLFVTHSTQVSMDALHVLLGVVLLLAVAAATRSSVARWHNCGVLLLLEVANEWLDLHVERWPSPGMQYGEGAKDLVLTMAVPVLLTLCARNAPGLLAGRPEATDSVGASAESTISAGPVEPLKVNSD